MLVFGSVLDGDVFFGLTFFGWIECVAFSGSLHSGDGVSIFKVSGIPHFIHSICW